MATISFKTLSQTLIELQRHQLITRKGYPQISPKVEYSLSERGRSLMPILDMMCQWGNHHRPFLTQFMLLLVDQYLHSNGLYWLTAT